MYTAAMQYKELPPHNNGIEAAFVFVAMIFIGTIIYLWWADRVVAAVLTCAVSFLTLAVYLAVQEIRHR